MNITIHSTRGHKLFSFPEGAKVEEAAGEAVRAFDFSLAHRYGLLLSGNPSTPLAAERTLASYNISEGAVLFLTVTSC